MYQTRFRNLSNKELLLSLNAKRDHSEIIEELCQRLEVEIKKPNKDNAIHCPVCEAKLFIEEDNSTEFFTARIFSEINKS